MIGMPFTMARDALHEGTWCPPGAVEDITESAFEDKEDEVRVHLARDGLQYSVNAEG